MDLGGEYLGPVMVPLLMEFELDQCGSRHHLLASSGSSLPLPQTQHSQLRAFSISSAWNSFPLDSSMAPFSLSSELWATSCHFAHNFSVKFEPCLLPAFLPSPSCPLRSTFLQMCAQFLTLQSVVSSTRREVLMNFVYGCISDF